MKQVRKWRSRIRKERRPSKVPYHTSHTEDNFGSPHKWTPVKVVPPEVSWSGARELELLCLCTHQSPKKGMGVDNLPGISSFPVCRQSRFLQSAPLTKKCKYGQGGLQNGKGIRVHIGRALTTSAQKCPSALNTQNKGNKVRTSVTHRTGFGRYQLDTWRLGPERLSGLPRVTQTAAKIPALVCLGEVHVVCQSLCTLFFPCCSLHWVFSMEAHPEEIFHVSQNFIDRTPAPAFRMLRPLWVSSGWPLAAHSP